MKANLVLSTWGTRTKSALEQGDLKPRHIQTHNVDVDVDVEVEEESYENSSLIPFQKHGPVTWRMLQYSQVNRPIVFR